MITGINVVFLYPNFIKTFRLLANEPQHSLRSLSKKESYISH